MVAQCVLSRDTALGRCQEGIIDVSGGAAAEEGRSIGNVQPGAHTQAVHEVRIGDVESAEGDQVGQIAAVATENLVRGDGVR